MNYRCLTEINSRYYGLSLFEVPIVPAIKGFDCTSADSQENNEFSFEVGVGGWGLGASLCYRDYKNANDQTTLTTSEGKGTLMNTRCSLVYL